MPLDNVYFPRPFRLDSRNPKGLTSDAQKAAVKNFQVAVFESAKRSSGNLKAVHIPAGEKILRSVASKHNSDANRVPSGASHSLANRWSGLIPETNMARGALYTSEDINGFVNEAMRHKRIGTTKEISWEGSKTGKAEYSFYGPTSKDYRELLVGKVYCVFTLKHSINAFDLSPRRAAKFYSQIENDRFYRAAREDLRVSQRLIPLVFDLVEYTTSRPVGLSVLLGCDGEGIRVVTAQDEAPELPGNGSNLVLGGEDGKEIEYLRATGFLLAGTSNHHPALLEIEAEGSHPGERNVVPGSVVETSTGPDTQP